MYGKLEGTRGAGRGRSLGPRLRRGAPVLLLLLSLLVAGVGAIEAVRAQRSHQATAEGLLRDYGAFAAWSFADRAAEEMGRSIQTTLYPLRTAFLRATNPSVCLEELLEEGQREAGSCGCGAPIAGRFAFMVRIAPEAPPPLFVGEPPEDHEQRALAGRVREHARTEWRRGWTYGLLSAGQEADGSPRLLAYSRLENAEGDTVAYGVHVDPARLRERMDTVLAHPDLLPPSLTRGQASTDLLAIQVRAADGPTLFTSHDGPFPGLHADQDLPERLGGGSVRAAVLPAAAEQLIIGGLPKDRLPWLLLVFGLSGALALVAISLFRKEDQLARLRSDFVASVSHELRSPLAQIRLFAETLRLGRARDEGERAWALERIERETTRLTGVIDNVLHFSRAERGLAGLECEPADLGQEVDEAARALTPLLPAGGVRIEAEVSTGLACELHRDAFRQVLLNLLDNAVKYGPPGQRVRVRGERTNGHVRLSVEDDGPGVPPAERERIFEAFRRGDAAVGGVVAGSGIGLSVVREIVHAHEGRVWVESASSGGARFVVELPALRTASPEQIAGSGRSAASMERERGDATAGAA